MLLVNAEKEPFSYKDACVVHGPRTELRSRRYARCQKVSQGLVQKDVQPCRSLGFACRLLARLRLAHRSQECLFIGVDRK
jgi:hypothetical protein